MSVKELSGDKRAQKELISMAMLGRTDEKAQDLSLRAYSNCSSTEKREK